MHKMRVAVLRGGPSTEYDVSLVTGGNVLRALQNKYHTKDILIDKDGVWHMDGLPTHPEKACRHVDVVFNAMHGEYGEDGKVQQILNLLSVPYTGSGAAASSMAMNKATTKQIFSRHGIKTPMGMVFDSELSPSEIAHSTFRKISPPWIVKPVNGGSSVGTSIARNFEELGRAVINAFGYGNSVLMEEFISGREATCGVIDNFRGQKNYSLLPVEIIKPKHRDFFDYECKYDGTSKEICPGNFDSSAKEEIQNLAMKIHNAMGLRHYSRSDFIVTPRRGIYALEVNTLPGLTPESLFPKSLAAIGCKYEHFLDHLINLALESK
ncbi:MAG TPA: D-alanine--D-alanine ligase family protein [Candidatus Paceibacterota bacterium]|nr:D-alanine--D-alanine ligase family protein [Candidatus Paceibacterota bacterium]